MPARGLRARIVALTGTPGCGKTTVADLLAGRGLPVLALSRYKGDPRFDEGADAEAHGTHVIDEAALSDHLLEHMADELAAADPEHRLDADDAGPVIIESHFAHELAFVDQIVVLQAPVEVLERRLTARGWQRSKVLANLEAERQDVILKEALAHQEEAAEEGYRIRVDVVETAGLPSDEVADEVWRLVHRSTSREPTGDTVDGPASSAAGSPTGSPTGPSSEH